MSRSILAADPLDEFGPKLKVFTFFLRLRLVPEISGDWFTRRRFTRSQKLLLKILTLRMRPPGRFLEKN